MELDTKFDMIAQRRAQRRGFFTAAAGLAAGGAILGHAGDAAAQTNLDVDILNFALNLEYLEAEFYLRAVGQTLNDNEINGTGTLGPVRDGNRPPVPFVTPIFREYAREIADDERAHVRFIRAVLQGVLGTTPVARPTLDLIDSFNTAASAAGIGPTFNPYENENNFLLGAFIFEDVGVTAYKGAARLITNKDVLEGAAGLLSVESYHAAEVRTLILSRGLNNPARAISRLRDQADDGGQRNKDQPPQRGGAANIVPTDSNGLTYSRTTDEVLNIVYLGGAAAQFGFFPDRLNGTIR